MQNMSLRRGCRNILLGVHSQCTSTAQRGGAVPGTNTRFTPSCSMQRYAAYGAGLNHTPARPLAYTIWEFASHP